MSPEPHFLVFGAPAIGEEEIAEVETVLRSGWLGTGPRVARFEADFADYKGVGASQVAGVNSCTAALHVAMVAAGLQPGAEVITTPLTFCATVNAIIHAGLTPVLADVDLAEQYMHASGYDPSHRAYELAMAEFRRAAALPGASPLPEQGLILLATAAAQPVDPSWWAAIESKLTSNRVGPQEVVAVTGLLQRHQEGLSLDPEALHRVIALLLTRRPDLPAHMAMAQADLAMKELADPQRTRAALREVARRSASDLGYVRQVASVLAADGHADEATFLLREAEAIQKDRPDTRQH